MKTTHLFLGILTTAIMAPTASHAWGNLGHKTSAMIAWQSLKPSAQDMVKHILDNDPVAGSSAAEKFVNGATWADEVRAQFGLLHTIDYHFETVPDQRGQDLLSQKNREPGAVEAILRAEQVLLSDASDALQKVKALKFMVHFIGDLHQPLHVGRKGDKGGNDIEFKFFTRTMSLHQAWDMGVIEKVNGDNFKRNPKTDPSAVYYKVIMTSAIAKTPVKANDGVNQWYTESRDLMDRAYSNDYLKNQDAYLKFANEAVATRIFLAGRRIANVLNRIADERKLSSPDLSLIKTVQSIFGQLENVVYVGPKGKKK